jgi:hypothetical protein
MSDTYLNIILFLSEIELGRMKIAKIKLSVFFGLVVQWLESHYKYEEVKNTNY